MHEREGRGEDRVAQRGDPPVVGGGRGGEVQAEDLDQHQLGQPGGDRVRAGVGRRGLLERVVDAGLHPTGGGPLRRAHDERRRQGPEGRVEQRVVGVEEPADEVDAGRRRPRGGWSAGRSTAADRAAR